MFFRYLFIVLALWVAIMIARHLLRSARSRDDASRSGSSTPTDTVRCAHCGLHVPRDEALCDGGHCYCCQAHREAGPG